MMRTIAVGLLVLVGCNGCYVIGFGMISMAAQSADMSKYSKAGVSEEQKRKDYQECDREAIYRCMVARGYRHVDAN
jgi:hypothetical protein